MPKVHDDQKAKFGDDDFFSKFHSSSEVRYIMPKAVEPGDRLANLQKDMQEDLCNIAFKGCGTNMPLRFKVTDGESWPAKEWADFDREAGKVHLRSRLILNGVCCRLVVVLDLDTFDGVGHLEYDDDLAKQEAKKALEVVDIVPRSKPAFQPLANPLKWEEDQALLDTKPY